MRVKRLARKCCGTISIALLLASSGAGARPENHLLAEIPIETASGGIPFFSGSVNSTGPLQFLLDTGGAGSSVKREVAERLGVKVEAGQTSAGGNASQAVEVIRDAIIHVGRASSVEGNLMAAPLKPLEPIFGHAIDGIVGGDWVRQYIVELDYEAKMMRLYDPKDFKYQGKGEALPMAVVHGIPFVDLKVTLPNGRSIWGHFLVNTGGGGMAVHIFKGIADRDKLAEGLTRVDETSRGAAGRFAVRGEEMELAKYHLRKPMVIITEDEAGRRVDPSSVGLVGMEVLQRFKVTLDYSRGRMYLEPNRRMREPFIYGATGMVMRAAPPSFSPPTIAGVREGSPAREAGLQAGDVLVKIDAQETSGLTLESVREMLRYPGQTHQLSVARGGKTIEIVLHTREMLP